MSESLKVVGQSELRKDAIKKVCGAAAYTADIILPDTCFGVLVRSPHHHARILSIDAAPALAMAGVTAVLTAQDVPGDKTFGSIVPDPARAGLRRSTPRGRAAGFGDRQKPGR